MAIKKIVFIQSGWLLKRFIRGASSEELPKYMYLACMEASSQVSGQLDEWGIAQLRTPPLEIKKQDECVWAYNRVMGELARWNGNHSIWWASHFSTKHRFASPFVPMMTDLYYCLWSISSDSPAVRARGEYTLIVIAMAWPLVHVLTKVASQRQIPSRIVAFPGSSLMYRLALSGRTWASLLKGVFEALAKIYQSHKAFGRPPLPKFSKPVYLLKSFTYPNSFDENGSYKDPFFGRLATFLKERLDNEATVVTVSLGSPECYSRFHSLDQPVYPLEYFLRYRDIGEQFVCVARRCLSPFKVNGSLNFLGVDIAPVFRELLKNGGWKPEFFQCLHKAAAERISRELPVKTCVLTFEGNAWERAFIAGLRRYAPQAEVLGYQHSMLCQAAVHSYPSQGELESCDLPDRIVTTGPKTEEFIRKFSDMPTNSVRATCALRYEHMQDVSLSPRRAGGTRRVLVAMDGVYEGRDMAFYALQEALDCEDTEFYIRSHPVCPLNQLLANSKWSLDHLPANVRWSRESTLQVDLEQCDAILYWGTTVALEGLLFGKPVVHYDRGDLLSYDPLFELTDLKWTTSRSVPLSQVLQKIWSLPVEDYQRQQARALEYVRGYHAPVNEESLALFLGNQISLSAH